VPNIDLVKIVLVVVLLAVVLGLVAVLVDLDVGGSDGRAAWFWLNEKPTTVTGNTLSWSPLTIATELLPDTFSMLNIPVLVGGLFGAALIAVFIVLLIKMILRVMGGG